MPEQTPDEDAPLRPTLQLVSADPDDPSTPRPHDGVVGAGPADSTDAGPAAADGGDRGPATGDAGPGRGAGAARPAEPRRAERRKADRPSSRVVDDGVPDHEDPVGAARAVLAAADPESHYKSLLSLSRPTHGDILQALPYTKSLQFHDPTCVTVEPEPTGLETVELYAHAAYPNFDEVLLAAFLDPRNDHLFNHVEQLLFHRGENVAVVTNHGQIIDIALVMGAFIVAMCRPQRSFGVLGETVSLDDLAPRINVLVSRMVATRQALGVPAMQVLQCGGRTFLSVPQTASRRRAKLDPAMVKANNTVMRHELDAQMARGGQLLAMAASGSQDLSLAGGLMQKARTAWLKRRGEEPPETPTLHLQPLYDGTMTLMQSCGNVLPIAISVDPDAPACVLGQMTRLRERDDCHRIMDWIAEAHQEVTGVPTIYHWHEDDLLTQVRSLAESLRR